MTYTQFLDNNFYQKEFNRNRDVLMYFMKIYQSLRLVNRKIQELTIETYKLYMEYDRIFNNNTLEHIESSEQLLDSMFNSDKTATKKDFDKLADIHNKKSGMLKVRTRKINKNMEILLEFLKNYEPEFYIEFMGTKEGE